MTNQFDPVKMAARLPNDGWKKASYSDATGNDCIELLLLPGAVAVHDSKNPRAAAYVFSSGAMAAFMAGVKSGAFQP